MDLVALVRAVHRGPLTEAQALGICKAIGTRVTIDVLNSLRKEWPEWLWHVVAREQDGAIVNELAVRKTAVMQ